MSDRQSYTQDQLGLVEGMVAQMSAAARNAKLYQAAQGEIAERKKIEESLRQSEERFRALANAIPAMVWTAAPDGTITYANEQWFVYCGLTPEQNARHWPELVLHPDDVDRCLTEWSQALQHGHNYQIEVRNRRYDGEYRWFLTRAVPACNAEGRVTGWYGTTTDIHERKQAEQNMLFLADLSEQMRHSEEPQALLWLVVQAVGDYLHVSRCFFSEVDVARGQEVIHGDYYQGLPSVAGTYAHASFSPATIAELQAGHTVVNVAVQQDERTAAYFEQSYRPYGIGAYVAVPLLRNNRWTAMLWVSVEQPRQWSEQEVNLLKTAAERAWLALEKARLDEALRRERAQLKRLNETLEQKVQEQTEQVRQLAADLTLTEQQERRQLARDLHDSAGQSLTALQIYLNLVEREIPGEFGALRQKMAEARTIAQEAHDEVRAISHAMRPPILDLWGLQVALEELCHDFARRTNLPVKYQGDELPSLDDQISINFYRFLQEALTNTAKHAQASAVQVVLSYQGDELLLSVEDDGAGFDAHQELSLVHSPTGMGLQGLQERFHLLGGQVEIDSEPGRGARLVARCHVVNK
jgi:PAS domain S-box-containing protein